MPANETACLLLFLKQFNFFDAIEGTRELRFQIELFVYRATQEPHPARVKI